MVGVDKIKLKTLCVLQPIPVINPDTLYHPSLLFMNMASSKRSNCSGFIPFKSGKGM